MHRKSRSSAVNPIKGLRIDVPRCTYTPGEPPAAPPGEPAMRDALNMSDSSAHGTKALTRQELLLAGAGGAALLGAGNLLAPRLAQAAPVKTGGTLRVGIGGG